MLHGMPGLPVVLALIAIAPGLLSAWRGRALVRLADDPALPERLLSAQKANGAALGGAFAFLAVGSPRALLWTLPLMVYATLLGAYPVRRALFGDTWSPVGYLSYVTRVLVGIWGFWIGLALMPLAIAAARPLDAVAAGIFALVLATWSVRYADVFRRLAGSRPLEDPQLLSRFHELVRASGIVMPRFERVDLRGGVVANALALPSLRGSSVIFTDTLLETLEPAETVAICAHEIAHLEHFNPRLLRRLLAVDLALIGSGAAAVPVSSAIGLSSYVAPLVVWFCAVLASMIWRARDRQRNETVSDLRAVALCGDGEALVRGLTRLYTMGRVPRRFDAEYEQRATHPSLARRIRDIRAAAGTAAASLDTTVNFVGSDGGATVTFEPDTLRWSEGEAAVHSLSYAHLSELRVDVRRSRGASLVAVERQGRRWTLPLRPEDVARAQAVLDVVDARLPPPAAPAAAWPKIRRLVLAFVAVLGLAAGQLAMAFVTLLALLQPAAPLVAAAGLAALTSAALLVRQGGAFGPVREFAFVLATLGVALIVAARYNREEAVPRRVVPWVSVLGACAALSVVGLAMGGIDPVRLHQSAQSATGTPVLLLAFAGGLALWGSPRARYAAIPVIVVAAATTATASSAFLDRFGDDLFLAPAEPFEWKTVDPNSDTPSEIMLPIRAATLRLSPAGSAVALTTSEPEDNEPFTFRVGRPGGTLAPVVADGLLFIDDNRILLMRRDRNGAELTESTVESPDTPVWRTRVEDIARAELSLSAARRWRIMGWTRDRGLARVEGFVGRDTTERMEWPSSGEDDDWLESVASSGNEALLVQTRYDVNFLHRSVHWRWSWLFPPPSETRIRVAGPHALADVGVSRLGGQCFAAALHGDELLCSAFDGTRTRFISIDPASKRVAGLAWMHGHFYAPVTSSTDWLAGWRDGAPVALNPLRRQGVRIAGARQHAIFQVAGSDAVVGTLGFDGAGSIVKLYRLR